MTMIKVACLLLAALASLPCAAQLRPCSGVGAVGHKLLVDDIGGAPSGTLDLLQVRVASALTQLQLETRASLPPSPPGASASAPKVKRLVAVRCEQRTPSSTAFTEALARELNNNEVVLEVWGKVVPRPAAEGAGSVVIVGYALVPVRHYMPRSPQGVLTIERRTRSADSTDQVIATLDQSDALKIYAAVGSGVRSFYAEEYDQAWIQLCHALARLERIPAPSPDDAELTEMVRTMSLEVVQRVRAAAARRSDMNVSNPTSCKLPPL